MNAEQIYQTLSGQRFADWYGEDGKFGQHITGEFPKDDPLNPTKAQIIADIKRLFELK